MDTALLFLAAVFNGKSKLERLTRWLFIIGFILTVTTIGALTFAENPIVVFEFVAVTINVIVLILTGTFLSLYFKRMSVKGQDG